MTPAIRESIRRRAGERCEYCLLPESAHDAIAFHVEHIIALQHGGTDDKSNLALACDRCNAYKGPNIASIDPASGATVRLYNPRLDRWLDHFIAVNFVIAGRTAIGRASVRLLNMNAPRRVQLRSMLELDLGS